MKLWTSGEIDNELIDEFRPQRNYIEKAINELICKKDYGKGLLCWDVIIVLSKSGGTEYVNFDKSKKETDIRVVIDYHKFRETYDDRIKKELLLEALIYSLEILKAKNIDDFLIEELIDDIVNYKKGLL